MPAAAIMQASFGFSTRGLRQTARTAAVRALDVRGVLPVRLEPSSDRHVRVEITKWGLPGLSILSGVLAGVRQEALPVGAVRDGDDDVFLGINLAGRSVARRGDREVVFGDGDAVLVTRGGGGFAIDRPMPARFLGVRLSRSGLKPLVTGLDGEAIRLVPRDTKGLGLLASSVSTVEKDELALEALELRRLVSTHVYDLASTVLGATRDAEEVAAGRGLRAARLRAIRADIAANLRDCGLSITAVAARQRVTPRYIHRLFEGEDITFTEFVLGQRLARAHRVLSDPSQAWRSISEVAYAVGFGDLSYFNRTFRRLYGATPSDVKRRPE